MTSPAPASIAQTTLATIVRTLATTLRQHYGIDPLPVLAQVGIDPAVMNDSELRLPMTTLSPLWLRCQEVSGDPSFGLQAVRYHQSANLYGIDLALYACATLAEAVQRQVQLVSLISTGGAASLHQDASGDWRIEFRPLAQAQPTMPARDFYLLFQIRMFERLTGKSAAQILRGIEFYRGAADTPALWQELGVPLHFDCDCATLIFRREHWDLPLPGANPRLLALVEQPILQYLAQHGMALPLSALRAQLAGLLERDCGAEQLASALGLSPERLHHSLRQHGLTFAQLLDQTREAQTLQLLANPDLALEQIATRVGFSSATSLAKAFRRWQDSTPMRYRRDILGQG
ncbi:MULTISPECIES: AraC family transcriptional regulator [unclassified Pseudomonas]|uniref:AraC family transcriptional regulator n=1 Tax=unclassified Pseudomonas TaxID=196821 RepID=UPI00244B6F96|nr:MULTISPECIES: AraC family transcriptional regulator [unclassified Pseudomonas]MDG9925115.1 AraC family transcriptional regulator [Pseudomonas sp. GD04045]MDH0037010.1 AraC family transcriptional regulator [Pseudomonas sp. GD04019]